MEARTTREWERIYVLAKTDLGLRVLRGAVAAAHEAKTKRLVLGITSHKLLEHRPEEVCGLISTAMSSQVPMPERLPFPVINVINAEGPLSGMGNLLNDDVAIGRLAAATLRDGGYKRCLVLSLSDLRVHRERAQGFLAAMQAAGLPAEHVEVSLLQAKSPHAGSLYYIDALAELLRTTMAALPLGSAIFATNDFLAIQVLCLLHRYLPAHADTLGVLGVDNENQGNTHFGDLPSLSTIEPDFHGLGYAALSWLLEHPGAEGRTAVTGLLRRFPPLRVIPRASTAVGACEDPLTARMIRWAWERLRRNEELSVGDMARFHRVSRKTLQRRFSTYAGATAQDMVLRLRLDLARILLAQSSLPIGEISDRCGFAKQDVLSRALRREEGCSPRDYRNRKKSGVTRVGC